MWSVRRIPSTSHGLWDLPQAKTLRPFLTSSSSPCPAVVSSLTSAYTHFQLRGLLLPAHPAQHISAGSPDPGPPSCPAQGWPCSTRNSDLSWIPPPLQLLSTAQAPTSCPLPPSTSAHVTGLHGSCSPILIQALHTCLLALAPSQARLL